MRFLPTSLARSVSGFALSLLAVASVVQGAEPASLVQYTFDRGSRAASGDAPGVYANAMSAGSASLIGFSPKSSLLYFLLKSASGEELPTTESDALARNAFVSFAVGPNQGSELALSSLSFDIGAASPRANFNVHAFVSVTVGKETYTEPVRFSVPKDGTSDLPSYAVKRGPSGEELPGKGVVHFEKLPNPLTGPATFRLFIYLDGVDEEILPGTNYSIRIDNLSLNGTASTLR